MLRLNISDLEQIQKICEIAGVEHFALTQDNSSGIGGILILTYDTTVGGRPAKISVEISGVDSW